MGIRKKNTKQMRKLLVLTFLLAIMSVSLQQTLKSKKPAAKATHKLTVKKSETSHKKVSPSHTVKAKVVVKGKAKKADKKVVSKVKPVAKTTKKSGKPADKKPKKVEKKPKKAEKKPKKVTKKPKKAVKISVSLKKKVQALKNKVAISQNKNSVKQNKLRKDKELTQAKVQSERAAIRHFKKQVVEAKLHDKIADYTSNKKKLLQFKANLNKSKKKLMKIRVGLKQVKAVITDNRATMTKI